MNHRLATSRLFSIAALLALTALLATLEYPRAAQAATTPEYRITKTVALGAPDRWDYVTFDPATKRVYVSHGDRVTVVDGAGGSIIGEVSGFPGGTHGIAVVSHAGRGYTDDGRGGVAGSFDLKTLQVQKRLTAAMDADGIAYDPVSGHVFVVCGDSGVVVVIDPKADAVISTIKVGGALEFAVTGGGKLYVNGAEKKEVVRIDTGTNQVDARWPIPQCESPHGVAVDTKTGRLFVSCVNNRLVVVDTHSGKSIAELPIGSGSDAVAFDPKRRLIFSSNGRDGTISVIAEQSADQFTSLGSVKTAVTARTMAIDPDSGRIYLVAAELEAPSSAATPPAAPATPPAAAAANPAGPPPAARRRIPIVPGSVKLWFLDPAS
jgi:YVTN family beta-propeller protein